MRTLELWKTYTREEVHDIFSPDTVFQPQGGSWGISGIVGIPNRKADWVFFVTFGSRQGAHNFDESITADGVLTWQSQPRQRLSDPRALRTAWQRHGLGLPPRPTATPTTPRLDSAFVALNRGLLPARERSSGELAAWVRREKEYATLGAEVVVELNSESRTRRPTTCAWAIIRRAQRAHQRTSDRQQRGERRQTDRASRTGRTGRTPAHVQEREVMGSDR